MVNIYNVFKYSGIDVKPAPVFAEPDPLPGAEGDAAITDGEGQVAAQQTRLRVGGHVVRALAAVLPRDRLRHQPAVRDSTSFHATKSGP